MELFYAYPKFYVGQAVDLSKSANYTRTFDAFRAREKEHTLLYYNEGPRLDQCLLDSSHQGDHQRTESANTLERAAYFGHFR